MGVTMEETAPDKSVMIQLRVSKAEREALFQEAAANGMSASQYIRKKVFGNPNKRKPTGRPRKNKTP